MRNGVVLRSPWRNRRIAPDDSGSSPTNATRYNMPWRLLTPCTLKTLTDADIGTAFPGGFPQYFMTGDGHRIPPFNWALQPPGLKVHLLTQMAQGKLCAHVEQHPEDVTEESVPPALYPLFLIKRVFGWELDVYRYIGKTMATCWALMGDVGTKAPAATAQAVANLHQQMTEVQNRLGEIGNPPVHGGGLAAHAPFLQYYSGNPAPNAAADEQYQVFLKDYFNWAMGLRTTDGVHHAIAANIKKVTDQYPDSTHLITCGNEHILTNALYNFIILPDGYEGVADPCNF